MQAFLTRKSHHFDANAIMLAEPISMDYILNIIAGFGLGARWMRWVKTRAGVETAPFGFIR
jgi:hypothetical protein